MNLEDIKEQLKDHTQNLWNYIQEHPVYVSSKERFQSFPPRRQKWVLSVSLTLIILLILSIPLSELSSSFDSENDFKEKRQLINDLLKPNQANGPNIPPPMLSSALQSRAQNILQSAGLVAKQIKGVRNTAFTIEKSPLIPKSIEAQSVEISVVKVNLKQVVNIAHRLSSMNRYVKLKDMAISPNHEDRNYSNATYTLVAVGLTPSKIAAEKPSSRRSRSKRSKRSKRRGRK